MPSYCEHCKIDLLYGTTDSNKCAKPLYPLGPPLIPYAGCCNCAKENDGWDHYDKRACLQ